MDNFWNDTTQELLVEYVELFPALWDERYETNKRKDRNIKRWNKIGKSLGCTGDDAQREFNKLRKRFLRYLERLGKDSSRSERPFFLTEKMLFLLVPDCFEVSSPEIPREESPPQSDMSDIYEEFLDSTEDTLSSTQLRQASEGSAASSLNLPNFNSRTTSTTNQNRFENRTFKKKNDYFEIRKLNFHRKRK